MQRRVVLLVGKTGSGKSYLAKRLRQRAHRSLTLDPQEEYDGTVIHSMEELWAYFEEYHPKEFQIACRFEDQLDDDFLFRYAWEVSDLLVVVEDSTTYLDARFPYPSFLRLVERGRHRGINLLTISQRVPNLSIALRAQYTTMISFKQDIPEDLKRLEEYGFENVQSLQESDLEEHHYLVIGEAIETVEFP